MTRKLLIPILMIAMVTSMSITSASAQVGTTQNTQTKFIDGSTLAIQVQYGGNGNGWIRSDFDVDGYKKVCAFVHGSGEGYLFSIIMASPTDPAAGAPVATGNFGSIICGDVEAPTMVLSLKGTPGKIDHIVWWIYLLP